MRNLLAALFAGVLWMSIAAHSFQEPIDPGSQLPPPTFRTSVNGVVLDLRVVDRNGHFVEDLSREDFRVYEDGREETVSTFELVDIPRAVPERRTFAGMPISSDVASNEHSEGRLYILLLDDRDVRALRSVTVRALAEEFVEQDVGPRDLVALATTSSRREMTVEFTNDKRRLLDAIDRFQGGFGTGNPLSEVRAVANMLPADGRRKTVVLISEGLPSGLPNLPNALSSGVGDRRSIFEMFSKRDRAVLDLRDVIEAAARNNVNIYAIDPMGHPGAPASGVKPLPYLIGESSLRTTRQDALTTVANETGGESLIGSNDFSNAFDRIVEESSHYYTLGYVSRNNARDGKFRQVSVQVDRPGVSVRTRTGYVAQDDKPPKPGSIPAGWSRQMVTVIQSPMQMAGLNMTVAAVPFRSKSGSSSVELVVETNPPYLQGSPAAAETNGSLEFAVVVADAAGHVITSGHLAAPVRRPSPSANGVRVLSRLELKPGHYALRVGCVDDVSGANGSVHETLDVPDLSSRPLAMSGVVLSSTLERDRPIAGGDEQWLQRFPEIPTATRVFSSNDDLSFLADIYNNGSRTAPVEVTTSVRSESGTVVFSDNETLADVATGEPGSLRFQKTTSLSHLRPGLYLLTIEARSTAKVWSGPGGPTLPDPISHQVLFTVQ